MIQQSEAYHAELLSNALDQVLGYRLGEVVRIIVLGLNISHGNISLHDVVADKVVFRVDMLEPGVKCLIFCDLDASGVIHEDHRNVAPKAETMQQMPME